MTSSSDNTCDRTSDQPSALVEHLLRTDAPRNEARIAFARLLLARMSPATFGLFEPAALADALTELHQLMLARQQASLVRLVPVPAGNRWSLVVQCPDAPYLFDALQNLLQRQQWDFHVLCHPLLRVDRRSETVRVGGLQAEGELEALIWISLDGLGRAQAAVLTRELEAMVAAVLQLQRDRPAMCEQLEALAAEPALAAGRPLLTWLLDGNFVPTALRRLQQPGRDDPQAPVSLDPSASLGLAAPVDELLTAALPLAALPAGWQRLLLRGEPICLEEQAEPGPFNRFERLVGFGFRRPAGEGWEEWLCYGFFTQKAQDEVCSAIPHLRQRLAVVLADLGIPPESHDFAKAVEIVNAFPKVELFLMSDAELCRVVHQFPLIYRHEGVRLIPMPRLSPNRLTLLTILPKDYYSPERLTRIETYLARHFKTETVDSRITHVSRSYLSLHLHIHTARETPSLHDGRLEAALTRMALPWPLMLRRQLAAQDPEGAPELWRCYADAFDPRYQTRVHPRYAVRDIRAIEQLLADGSESFDLWGPFQEGVESSYRLQFYSQQPSTLNELMPYLDNLLLAVVEEVDFDLRIDGRCVYLKSFTIRAGSPAALDLTQLRESLLQTLAALRAGRVENDRLHRLQPLTGLAWPQIDVLRGYRNYYFQLGTPYTRASVDGALYRQPQVALLLYRYFEARFQVDAAMDEVEREERIAPLRQQLAEALQAVADINEDRILRTFFNLIDSTVRTSFFRRCGRPDYFFAFKVSALGILEMPAPRPQFEIYVHSAAMEGLHLRGGRVARGGIRWSDRPDDFRTEILGLMKAQMTKNAVIVPVGAKGGFIVKTPWQDREEGGRLAKEAYITLMRGLLDLTDNRRDGQVVPPPEVAAWDEDDPYLVVAADKGTAHLSDTANAVAADYGFWLGDAFASGGRYGYDHKRLGITARGAWECVRRHFRELGRDIQTEPFTVVGIGDMSGDVFGNGMLLSRQTRLLAAFDHRHIFLDPDPDPASSFRERQRLFGLERSSWDDYDRSLLSAGGGIFPRQGKEIPLSEPVRHWLGVRTEVIDGEELIRLLLQAPVDLLWNGGIGTYVKASEESQEQVGDRANDAVRIDAAQLRALVVGEGGNLGFTQRGRIEYALKGGRINTDALDNSAGVDCSDHEVNLKILLQHLRQLGQLDGPETVHRQVEAVTEAVAAKVLQHNRSQSLCLSLEQVRAQRNAEPLLELLDRLVSSGLLDRDGEFLPTTRQVQARSGDPFTRPELAVLLAYSKMALYRALLDSSLPTAPEVRELLCGYFPAPVVERFGVEAIADHPLAREIAATVLTNRMIDQAGIAGWHQLARTTGAGGADIVRAYLQVEQVIEADGLRAAVLAAERLSADAQHHWLLELEGTLAAWCRYRLAQGEKAPSVGDSRQRLLVFLPMLGSLLPANLWAECEQQAAELTEAGVDSSLATRLAVLPQLRLLPALAELADASGDDLYSVARTHAEVVRTLELERVLAQLDSVACTDIWDRQAGEALRAQLGRLALQLTRAVLLDTGGNPDTWLSRRRVRWRVWRTLAEELRAATPTNFHPFVALQHALQDLLE